MVMMMEISSNPRWGSDYLIYLFSTPLRKSTKHGSLTTIAFGTLPILA